MGKCEICKCELNELNVARWNGTRKNGELRYDATGNLWCEKCANEFDSIDWSD